MSSSQPPFAMLRLPKKEQLERLRSLLDTPHKEWALDDIQTMTRFCVEVIRAADPQTWQIRLAHAALATLQPVLNELNERVGPQPWQDDMGDLLDGLIKSYREPQQPGGRSN